MMKGSESMGYDRGLTTFSPEGRIYQVEYALEAVKRGTLAIGMKATDGAVLCVHKKVPSKLMNADQIHKIYLIDKHIGVAISGLNADARILTDQSRIYSAIHRLTYDENTPVSLIVRKICDICQAYSQHGGMRPFGAALMFVGVDDKGPQIYTTSPSGTYFSWVARAIGYKSDECQDYMKDEYKEIKPLKDAQKIAVKTLIKFVEDELTPETLDVGIISVEDNMFRIMGDDERKALLESVKSESKK